jgi:uncharacterized membrane protein
MNTSVNKTIQQNEHVCKQNNTTKWTPLYTKQLNKINTYKQKNQQNEHLCKQNNFILLNCFVYRHLHFVEFLCLQRCSFCWIVLFTDVFILLNCFVYRGVHFVGLFCLQPSSFCWIVLFTEVFILLNCFVYRYLHFVEFQNEHLCKQNNLTTWTPL